MKYKVLFVMTMFACSISFSLNAQQENLSNQFDEMVESSETFEKYKVISIAKINAFKSQLNDSLMSLKQQIQTSQSDRKNAITLADSAQRNMKDLQVALEMTQKAVDEIFLLGIPMTKKAYNITMWSIVIVLIVGLVLIYMTYLNSSRLTKQANKDKDRLDNELEELRKRSHEKQLKIKRELQTALNKLDEMNR